MKFDKVCGGTTMFVLLSLTKFIEALTMFVMLSSQSLWGPYKVCVRFVCPTSRPGQAGRLKSISMI